MVIISKNRLIEFYTAHPKAKDVLLKWYYQTVISDWRNFGEMKQVFNSVDSVGNDRFVFNIGGNKWRVVAMIHFTTRTVYIRFVGTHQDYDSIDCKTI